MSIFKDLGFKKRSSTGAFVVPDTNKFNGKTYDEFLSEVVSTPSISPDVDGTITISEFPVTYSWDDYIIAGSNDATSYGLFYINAGKIWWVGFSGKQFTATENLKIIIETENSTVECQVGSFLNEIVNARTDVQGRFPVLINGVDYSQRTNLTVANILSDLGSDWSVGPNANAIIPAVPHTIKAYDAVLSENSFGYTEIPNNVIVGQEPEQGNWVQYKAEATNIDGDLYINDTLQVVESVNGSITTYTTQTTDTDQLTISTDGTVDSVSIDTWVAG